MSDDVNVFISPGPRVMPRNFGFGSPWMGLLLMLTFLKLKMLNVVFVALILRRHLEDHFCMFMR